MSHICVCENCGKPAVDTFAFNGWEMFCPSCESGGDLFWGKSVRLTDELAADYMRLVKEFEEKLKTFQYDHIRRLNSAHRKPVESVT